MYELYRDISSSISVCAGTLLIPFLASVKRSSTERMRAVLCQKPDGALRRHVIQLSVRLCNKTAFKPTCESYIHY
jgi:hypothetical protein